MISLPHVVYPLMLLRDDSSVGSVVDRLPFFDKLGRLLNSTTDFVWHPAATLPEVSIFTHST